jgi:hypothetical protein
MESYEALANVIQRKTPTHAKALGLSVSAVSKWQEPSVDFSDSGSLNPLDRIETIIRTATSLGMPIETALSPVHYLGEKFNFTILPLPAKEHADLADLSRQLHKVVSEFSHVLQEASDALEDGKISANERRGIEREALHLYIALGSFLSQVQQAAR